MQFDTEEKCKVTFESLCISLDNSISTLQSNYYINKVCRAYSKMVCLAEICNLICMRENFLFKLSEYDILQAKASTLGISVMHFDGHSDRWYNLSNYEDARIFFKLFNAHELPYVQVLYKGTSSYFKQDAIISLSSNDMLPVHDFDNDALKVILVKHFSPPEYFVKGIEIILDYLITNKRDEELRKIEACLKYQEFICKDLNIVKEIVSIGKLLSDETIDDRFKIYALNSLQRILIEQEELHKRMGVTPTITHINILT